MRSAREYSSSEETQRNFEGTMVEALAEILTLGFHLNLNENNNPDSNRQLHLPVLSRKASTNDSTDNSSASHGSSHRANSDPSQDTAAAAEKPAANLSKRHQSSTHNNPEHNLSSQLSVSQSGKHSSRTPVQQWPPHRTHHLTHNHNEAAAAPPKNHDLRVNRVPTDRRTDEGIPSPLPRQPFRLIFMRHSERVNHVLGADWLHKAFRNNSYQQYDENLPMILPQRRSYQDFEFDSPLTNRGLKNALNVGRALKKMNLVADICLSSCALRCIHTSERVLAGMERQNNIPIRVEPGLFECPHFSYKIVQSFMTKKELLNVGFNIKPDYTPLRANVTVPESLKDYFERSEQVIRAIIDRYYAYGGTVLIVTHAPGLLALTDAIKGLRPDPDTFYRTVATYPPLAIRLAEYDGAKWKFTEQP